MGAPVVHFEIGCRDKEGTAAFYEQAFGWGTEEYGPSGKLIDTQADRGVHGHITALGHEPHHYVLVYIEVEDIDASAAAVAEAGGEVLIGPLEIPGQGRRFAWFKDPAGNTLGMISPN